MLDSTVSFSHYVYLLQGIHSRTFYLHTQTNFRFSTARVGWFSRALTCFACSNMHIKNYCAIARRKTIPFYPARTGINFSYFLLARRSFRFPSQLISQCFIFKFYLKSGYFVERLRWVPLREYQHEERALLFDGCRISDREQPPKICEGGKCGRTTSHVLSHYLLYCCIFSIRLWVYSRIVQSLEQMIPWT